MKKIVFLLLTIILSSSLQAQQHWSKEQREVQQTVVQLFESLSNRDSVSLKTNCTADIVFIEYGSTWTMDTLLLKAITLNTAPDFKRTNRFDFISTTVNGNTAWTTYHLQSEITREGKLTTMQWIETVVAVKEKNRWKISSLHSTLVKRY